jgi:hypothetical protein
VRLVSSHRVVARWFRGEAMRWMDYMRRTNIAWRLLNETSCACFPEEAAREQSKTRLVRARPATEKNCMEEGRALFQKKS